MVAAVKNAGVDAVVLSTDADGIRPSCVPSPGWEIREGIKVHYSRCRGFSKPSPIGRYFFAPEMARQLAGQVRHFDLLHLIGTWVFPTLAGSRIALLLDKPYVLSAMGSLFPWALEYKSLKKRIYLDLFEKKTLLNAARVHFTSMLEERQARVVFPGLPSVVIPNPVMSPPENLEGVSFRKIIGIEDTVPLVVFLGRIHAVKGLDLLIEAASEVVKEIPGTVFALVGNDEGGHASEIRDTIAKRGLERTVLLPGWVQGNEKWAVFAAADVFVLPSHQESFGMSIAEAMASGVPVVTSNLVGIGEDIKEAGAGLVVERATDMFVQSILSLLRDAALRRRMGSAGRELVGRKYAPWVVAHAMTNLYEEVIHQYTRRPISCSARACRTALGWYSDSKVN